MKRFLPILVLFVSTITFAQTSLPTAWNFSVPGITTPPNGWTLMNTLPASTGGQTYAFGIGDALACRFDAAGEYLTINFADKPGIMTYYVSPQNAGNTWTGQFDVQQSADGSNWTSLKTFTTWPSTVTNFTNGKQTELGLLSTSRFVRFMLTTKTSGNFALDSVLILPSPPPVTPTINIKQGTSNVVMGSTYVNAKTAATTFTIENKGLSQTLNITGITFTGKDSADYSVSNVPTSVSALGSANFTLNFTAAQNGSRKATMHIASNDVDKSDYIINLYGIGGSLATQPNATVAAVNISNVTACGMDVKFIAPGTPPEHYLVLRQKGGSVIDAPTDGITYQRGDYIGSAQVAYIGDSVSTLRPTYILANTTYGYEVFCFNGPKGYENYMPAGVTAATNTPGKNIGTYYNGIFSSDSTLPSKLTNKINPHDTIFYSQYILRLINPFIGRDTSGGMKVVNCVYTTLPQIYTEPFLWWNGTNSASLTREHTYCQSWMPSRNAPNWPNAANGKEFPEYNDMHHLFPADQQYGNGVRSNYPFGEVVTNPQPSPTGMGRLGKDANGATVWEPRDEQKGDVARALFYMCTAYNGINGLNWSLPSAQDQAVLKKWHFQDLPDNYEIARHEFIALQQHNRNPFIDSVNYVCHINFSNMSYIANPGPCGLIDPVLQITKPIGGESFQGNSIDTVKWMSSGMDSIRVLLYVADTLYQNFGTFAASNSKALWTVPHYAFLNSNKCKMKLEEKGTARFAMSPNYFSISNPDALDELINNNQVQVYPNPSKGNVKLSTNNNIIISQITVRDITGRIVKELDGKLNTTEFELNQQGVYIIEIVTNKGTAFKKLIIE